MKPGIDEKNSSMEMRIREILKEVPVLREAAAGKELVWMNPGLRPFSRAEENQVLSMEDVEDAEKRLERFAPLLMEYFPETRENRGIIESRLTRIEKMQESLEHTYSVQIPGKLYLKQDNDLPVAGSVKARGGIYEILKHTEELALRNGLLKPGESYAKLAGEDCRKFFREYTVQVGSTGNLGLSIGIMSAAIGYQVIIHMSADARQWKKDLLRSHGVAVVEYESDYSAAVVQGRKLSDEDPKSYFVDDENSRDLFLGYAVAAKRLKKQLEAEKIVEDESHPLFVYLPCGVGGAPGGICFGLKQIFGDAVHCFFIEPAQAPCMLAGMASGLHNEIRVQDIGLSGQTHADGLAVGRPSGFVGKVMEPLLSGIFTVEDKKLYAYMRELLSEEQIFLEPSACASFEGPVRLMEYEETGNYIRNHGLADKMNQAVHISWGTGGRLVPEEVREMYQNTYLK